MYYWYKIWGSGTQWTPSLVRRPHGCSLYENIKNGCEWFSGFKKGVVGRRIRFWLDVWCGEVALKDLFLDLSSMLRIRMLW